ncbi:iron(III) transport system ATP-binding protein [Luteibacter rhizovicinus]|uniref:Iron(III) transport system ATP-binding protein n=1 Tax=Luteibacter rhizovicinus TaxID=242606 RepID=A0A4V2W471_9GAMM|nr:ATP-binding cassette domain-containing protein [Luteibacter rhizovicinus]TCV94769.1 iron(III) transport system ATP-binding protein [Luteibacter rhizovicinus]
MYLHIDDIGKSFAGERVLDHVGLHVDKGEFVCLLGPSGCGKTTLLRIVAGLLAADTGRIHLGGRDLTGVPARDRRMGLVFQSYSLFPDMTVAANIGYAMRIRGESSARIADRTAELLGLVGLSTLAARYPADLSGGQQQRVALARALAVEPSLLLLDEPLSALDARVRTQMRTEIRTLQRTLSIPTIMVTHDQEEALALADTIVCMNHGRIEQVGSPRDLYEHPASRFVAEFIGSSNLLPVDWIRDALPALIEQRAAAVRPAHELCLRPEDFLIHIDATGDAQVEDIVFLGNLARVGVRWRGRRILVETQGRSSLRAGDTIGLGVREGRGTWLPA